MAEAGAGATADRWVGRKPIARAIKVVVIALPLAVSVATALVLSGRAPIAHTWGQAGVRLIAIGACSTLAMFIADRLTRTLLPLSALLDLTLVFPDKAPSRYKVAMRAGGTRKLETRLAELRRTGEHNAAQATERLLSLVGELNKHDRMTRGHSERVRAYSQMIAEEMRLPAAEVDKLRWAALLHDIGKLEISAKILNKPGALTDSEYEIIKRHPAAGAALTASLAGWLGDPIRAVVEHHEHWNGGGYPNRLWGHDISQAARIVSVADVFDVLTSVRSYHQPISVRAAREELAREAGGQFDPAVVRAFLNISLGKLRKAVGPLSWLAQRAILPAGVVSASAAPALLALAGLGAAALGTAVESGPVGSSQRTVAVTAAAPQRAVTTDVSAPVVVDSVPLPAVGPITPVVDKTTGSTDPTTIPSSPATTTSTTTATTSTTFVGTATGADPQVTTATSSYLLGAGAIGDSVSRDVLTLGPGQPANTGGLPNFDTDRDAKPGLTLHGRGVIGLGTPTSMQRFRLAAATPAAFTVSGSASVSLYAAFEHFDPSDLQAATAALADCDSAGTTCKPYAISTIDAVAPDAAHDEFSRFTFDFGPQLRRIAAGHSLELWIIDTQDSNATMVLAFDTTTYASSLTITA